MMSTPLWDVEVSRMAVGVLLDASVKGLVILLLAALAVLLLRRASAAARHLVWSLAFAALLALPLLSAALPRWEIPVWPASAPVATRISLAPTRAVVSSTGLYVPGTSPAPDVPATALSWSTVVVWTWLAGAVLALATLLFGMVRVRWLARRSRPVKNGPRAALAERLRAEFGLRRPVTLLESRDSVMPMTWGTLRPVVLLPASAGHWPAPRCEAVLRHELAHVQRWDALTQLGAELACALYWFNPLVWVAVRWLRIEREQACDDRVLGAGTKASDYASQLLETARSLQVARGTSGAVVAIARRSQLSGRLRAVLDEKRCRGIVPRRRAISASLTVGVLAFPFAALAPASSASVGTDEMQMSVRKSEYAREVDNQRITFLNGRTFGSSARQSEPAVRGLSPVGAGAAGELPASAGDLLLGEKAQMGAARLERAPMETKDREGYTQGVTQKQATFSRDKAGPGQGDTIRPQPSPMTEDLKKADAALRREYPHLLREGLPPDRYVWFLANSEGQVQQSGLADLDTAPGDNWSFNMVRAELRTRLDGVPFHLDLIARGVRFGEGQTFERLNVAWATVR